MDLTWRTGGLDEMEESRWEFPARCECVRLYAQGSPSPSGRRIVRGSKGSSRTEPHPRRMFSAPTPCCGLPTGLARELSDPGGSTRSDAQGEPSRADTRCETHQASTTPHRSKPGTAWRGVPRPWATAYQEFAAKKKQPIAEGASRDSHRFVTPFDRPRSGGAFL